MRAVHLRTEYLDRPLGIGCAEPHFSWHCEGGVAQTAYQIVASKDGKTVWDSGKVESARMTHIAYGGPKLHSRERIYWSVVLWDEEGRPGEACESWFEMGLLERSDWKASWIAGDYKPDKKTRYPVDCFKNEFAAQKKVAKARLYASARGIYDVTVNGHRIEDFSLAPGMTDYRKRIQYQTYDVTGFLSTPFLLPVLVEAGEAETAYKMLLNEEKPGWLAEVRDGATTVWENWEGNLSQNHYSPGAVCQWLFDTVCGIRVDGENHFSIAPVPGGGLDHAEARYLSPCGLVTLGWKQTGHGIQYKITVPSNCTATVIIGGRRETVKAGVH